MRIGIDTEDAAVIKSSLVPAPVEVQPPRMGIDFDSNAIFSACFDGIL
jgi:hypothetical protein